MAQQFQPAPAIVDDVISLLAMWSFNRFLSQTGWDLVGITDEECSSTLDLLMCLAGMNKNIRNVLKNTAKFTALWLAVYDARLHRHRARVRIDTCWANLTMLRTSWSLSSPMPEHLCKSPFSNFTFANLLELRMYLSKGWSEPLSRIPRGIDIENPVVWVCPEARLRLN